MYPREEEGNFHVRIFTVDDELDFADHPSIIQAWIMEDVKRVGSICVRGGSFFAAGNQIF